MPDHVGRPECHVPLSLFHSLETGWSEADDYQASAILLFFSLQCQGFSDTPQYPGLYLGSGIQTQVLMLVPLSPPCSPILSYFLFRGHTLSLHISRSLLVLFAHLEILCHQRTLSSLQLYVIIQACLPDLQPLFVGHKAA